VPESGWAHVRGTAVLANRQVLFAFDGYDEATDSANVTLRVLPLD
jgi:hypothetical protein